MAKGKNYANEIRKNMRSFGTYKTEYEPAILMLADMQRQYEAIRKEFEESGYRYYDLTENGKKKAAIVTTLESLRKDILAYMNALGLTPRMAAQADMLPKDGQKKKSNLAAALERLSDSS